MALKNTRQCRIQTLRYVGAPVIQTLIKEGGEGGLPKKFVLAFWASVWSKNKRGGRAPSPLPWIRHCKKTFWFNKLFNN